MLVNLMSELDSEEKEILEAFEADQLKRVRNRRQERTRHREAEMERVFVAALTRPYMFQAPVPGKEYAAWILSCDRTQTADERDRIASGLVNSGCRYAVCSGFESSRWDDAIDWAFLGTSPEFDPPDDKFVMTSWHEQDSLREVAEFFVFNTSFDFFVPAAFVIVAVGDAPETDEAERLVRALLQSKDGRNGS